ncbi:hypothetical protein ACN93_15095 [Gordonia paraffinivorans]|uniref:ATP-binding protein n=1 Tax=Gordonia paraffinivorans TaxID=175628 RepID=UPI000D6224ED|nr:AAA family ATPase [Gordonia paraffinivorans]PWD42218.1 hypothetical protein ACN93_15095 [Gordonia paraffinivorans]
MTKEVVLGITEEPAVVDDDVAEEIESLQSLYALTEAENERLRAKLTKFKTDELDKLRRYYENRDTVDAERAAKRAGELRGEIPAPVTLTDLLAEPDEAIDYSIDGLLPVGARSVVVAPRKVGKTTWIGNLCRAHADQVPFLGTFATRARTVAVIDVEMSRQQTRRWLRDQDIKNTDAVRLIPLRGKAATFNILDDATRAEWAEILCGVGVVVLDCLRPILDALGLNEHTDAGKFLVAFDALLAECGASEAVVVHHAGHGENRARGDSRIEDWPDVICYLGTEDKKDLAAERTFAAIGRDVEVLKGVLEYDAETRHLTYVPPVPDAAKVAKDAERISRNTAARAAVIEYVRTQNGIGVEPTKTVTEAQAGDGIGRRDIRKAVAALIESGELVLTTRGRSHHLRAVDPFEAVPLKPQNPFADPAKPQVSASATIRHPETDETGASVADTRSDGWRIPDAV